MRLVTLGRAKTPELRTIADWLRSLQPQEKVPPQASRPTTAGELDVSLCLIEIPAWPALISHGNAPGTAQTSAPATGEPLFQIATADLVLVWQEHPDACSRADVNQLLSTAVFARVIVVNGPWAEAAIRTRQVWPGALQVPFWNAETLIEHELVWRSTEPTARVAHTITRDELWSRLCSTEQPQSSGRGRVPECSPNHSTVQAVPSADSAQLQISAEDRLIISSPHPELASLWHDLALSAGWKTDQISREYDRSRSVIDEPGRSHTTVLFDADPWPQREPELQYWGKGGAVVIAVLSWPTAQTCAALRASGVSTIQSKLTFVPDMLIPGAK